MTDVQTEIPPMTNKLGRYWKQPPRELIEVDDTHALMDKSTWKKLERYDCSVPSGVYSGKMWSTELPNGKRYLRWYGMETIDVRRDKPVEVCEIISREVLLI